MKLITNYSVTKRPTNQPTTMIEICEATEDNPFIHGMSKQFVKALQQLFDVMDTEQLGTIRFIDLANQWKEDDGDPFFPKGLISCLAKVQLSNGLLTFDRFCAGIKLCLLKNQVDIKDFGTLMHRSPLPSQEEQQQHQATTNYQRNDMQNMDNNATMMMMHAQNSHHQHHNHHGLHDRPSSEPQILAPPPPPSLSSSSSANNHGNHHHEVTVPKILIPSTPTQMSPNIANSLSVQEEISRTSTIMSNGSSGVQSKKLPLPSYEQVMAAKSKPTPKLPNEPQPTTSSPGSSTNNEDPSILIAKTNFTKVINQFESQYGTNSNSNRIIKPINQQTNASKRAKSMSHLDYLPSDHHHHHHHHGGGINTDQVNPQQTRQSASDKQHQQQWMMMNKMDMLMINGGNPSQNNKPSSSTISGHSTTPSVAIQQSSPSSSQQPQSQPKTLSRNCIMKTLQNWRDNILHNKQVNPYDLRVKNAGSTAAVLPQHNPNMVVDDMMFMDHHETTSQSLFINYNHNNDLSSVNSNSLKRGSLRRREPRRHTVGANGIDLYSVKRFQQLEQEKEILISGLAEVEKTKDWYIRQISSIQDKINFAGRCGTFPSDCNIDAYQERINFQAIRIQTLNQHLVSLREMGQTFPMHMNLAIRPLNGILKIDPNQPKQLVVNPNLVNRLKEQNRLLTDEVTRKSERITQLEREKSSLIRELFQARTYSSYYNGHFDDSFM